jgi:hypothetical protein
MNALTLHFQLLIAYRRQPIAGTIIQYYSMYHSTENTTFGCASTMVLRHSFLDYLICANGSELHLGKICRVR